MRLISLTANQESFHAVDFRPHGVSLIVGSQKNKEKDTPGRTYNGVGKSLLVALIHFCLGSDKNKEFAEKLPDWQFILHFQHGGASYRVSRHTEEQNVVSLNGEEIRVTEYRKLLGQMVFPRAESVPNLSFRSLINHFIRPRKESYNAFDKVVAQAKPYQSLLENAYLLGLNTELVTTKHDLRSEQDRVQTLRQNLGKDGIFKDFFTGNRNPDIELADLDGKIKDLKRNIDNFNVAEDYHERQQEANAATRKVQELRNELVVVRNAIGEIDRSLIVSPDISPETINQIFDEANVALPEMVQKRVEEVAAFHRELLENRIKRLTSERTALERRMDRIEKDIKKANEDAEALLRYLGSHGALDELVAMNERLRELETRAQKLRDYQSLLAQYSDRAQEISAGMATQTIRTNRYLLDARPVIQANMDRFRSLSQRFYRDRPCGLSVQNNEGENQIRFGIDARIEDDAADGINEVKIFCYDMTLLTQRHNHNVDFLFHDSRLVSDVDVRQRATIFKIAYDVTAGGEFQYIATLNQDQIDAMRDQFTAEEFKKCIEDAIRLRLTDESPAAKLLGVEVDMHFS